MPAAEMLATAKLTYVDDFTRGYTRVPLRDGFAYTGLTGRRVRAPHIVTRLDGIALPPAYVDAWYCTDARGHIQATGVDARGRRQYRYHPDFRAMAEDGKFAATADFGRALPAIRAAVEAALAKRDLSRDRVIAGVVRLLDSGAIRVGNMAYAQANKSFGATTLRNCHAAVARDTLRLEFMGKSGKAHSITLQDRRLARVVRDCLDLPGQNLFQYVDDGGVRHVIDSGDVNAWLRDHGGDYTAKSFRTWHASVLAFDAMVAANGAARLKPVLELVAQRLGNTPAIARKSYVHPRLIAVLTGAAEWQDRWAKLPRATRFLSRSERGLVAFLDEPADEA
jgi:DNA topoisomerase I